MASLAGSCGPTVVVRRWRPLQYTAGVALQQALAKQRQQGHIPDQLLLVEHPPVITLGKRRSSTTHIRATEEELKQEGVELIQSSRGGDITFHGPGQIVMYPILDLRDYKKDLRWYVTKLEQIMIDTCASYGIASGRRDGYTGVWCGQGKIGACGVNASHWVTSHGIGFNVTTDLSFFNLIVPCGISDNGLHVTSLAQELGSVDPSGKKLALSLQSVENRMLSAFVDSFDCTIVESDAEENNRLLESVDHT
eukprot:GFYU01007449.1.p1 GENE.GFYU01007449.1~~GFYU01007449.1.p1  ORF type:complete len:251 (+),score=27.91 GFYU01007449.1:43-795(+)